MRGFPLIKAWAGGDKEAGEQISTLWRKTDSSMTEEEDAASQSISCDWVVLKDVKIRYVINTFLVWLQLQQQNPPHCNDHSSVQGFVVWLKLTVDRLDLKPRGM